MASLLAQMVSLVTQTVKNLSAMSETWVRSLGQEVPLEKGMTTHSSILAWRIPWSEEPGRATVHGDLKEPDANEQLTIFFPQYLKSTMQAN